MKKRKIVKVLSGIFIAIICTLGGIYYMSYRAATERNDRLIQHGFKLLEEQIATYIKENYSGVSKIEFSPIFVDGGDGFSMFTANVVPVVYDTEGNRAVLGSSGTIEGPYSDFGTPAGLNITFDGLGDQVIELVVKPNKIVEVSDYDNLPDFAKLSEDEGLDNNLIALNSEGYLKNVIKDEVGSPDVKITYNLEIVEGEYWKWP
ncbi:hypothetical protein [Streptococcus sp.]|uniref:hypothetical protein n=1 Tax=Streptococcus sp. TaxID=1306 RepID=UPI0035A11A4B